MIDISSQFGISNIGVVLMCEHVFDSGISHAWVKNEMSGELENWEFDGSFLVESVLIQTPGGVLSFSRAN